MWNQIQQSEEGKEGQGEDSLENLARICGVKSWDVSDFLEMSFGGSM